MRSETRQADSPRLYGRAALQGSDPDVWTMPDGSRIPISILPDDALGELIHQLIAHAEVTRIMIREDLLAGIADASPEDAEALKRELSGLDDLDSDGLLTLYVPQWSTCSREFRRRAARHRAN